MNVKLSPPVENFSFLTCSQLFGVSRKYYEEKYNIKGHNGIDIIFPGQPKNGYGAKILAAHDGIVSSVTFDTYPLHTRGNGIYIDSLDKTFTTVYWHCSEVLITSQKEVSAGDVIALAGNTGLVNPLPTKEAPYNAVHLHFGVKDNTILNNEYNKFIDPVPFLYRIGNRLPMHFTRDLFFGIEGADVSHLQTIFTIEGFAQDYQPIEFFGDRTLRDAKLFQERYGVLPAKGYVGSKTRAILNTMYT